MITWQSRLLLSGIYTKVAVLVFPSVYSRRSINVKMSERSELCSWLKSLPGGFHLERCSREFEICGSLSSLEYLRPGDIDAFSQSPEKLLLAKNEF